MRDNESKLIKFIGKSLTRFNLREKILGIFLICVIIPLIFVDGIIINRVVTEERAEDQYIDENTTMTVFRYFDEALLNCQNIASSLNQNYKVGEVLGTDYETTFDYYEQYHKITENYFFQTLTRFGNMQIKLYTSNDTVVGGGYVGKIDTIKNASWYKAYMEDPNPYTFWCGYDESRAFNEAKRRIYYLQPLTYKNNNYDNFIRIDVDYGTVARAIENMGFADSVYVLDGDTILFSNEGNNNKGIAFETVTNLNDITCEYNPITLGNINRIVVNDERKHTLDYLSENWMLLLIVLIVSVFLPILVLRIINYSIVSRIQTLNNVFGKQVEGELVPVETPEGDDEISNLMNGYNRMVDEVNQLIQIVYKERLHEQEVNIAKQNAELLALHSQINPHFMFNALESIRMHSVIKGEYETAEMVEKLAIMERQYVDWGSDMVTISQEIASVEAYLLLQKYRFGDKLMYQLDVEEDCAYKSIPKLTVVTFVENACVHGMENKTQECWVFVRVYTEDTDMVIEVEDTGTGIDEDFIAEIIEKSKTIEIDDIKGSGHVGIYNALLRLKMTMDDNYRFDIESEEGIGTIIQIRIPIKPSKEDSQC